MGIFSWFGKAQVVTWVSSRVQWMDRNAKAYAEEGYRLNIIVFRCVDILATKMAAIPLVVTVNGEPRPDHPLARLLQKPNPTQAGADFWAACAAFRLISGNAYCEALRDKSSAALPAELWMWQPYQMKIAAPDRGYVPLGYAWQGIDGGNTEDRVWDVDRVTGRCNLGHWKTFHPTNPWYGMSPLDPAARAVDEHNAATAWNTNLLQNNATPSGVLAAKGTLTDKQYARLKDQIEQRMQGPENARRPLLLEGDMSWTQVAMTPQEMDWLAGKKMSAQDIAAAFGVPMQVIPIEGSQTFANYEQARLSLYEDAILPLLDSNLDWLNTWLVPMYNEPGLLISYDQDAVAALETKRQAKWFSINGASFLTLNEKREEMGYGRTDDKEADMLWMPAGQLPIGEGEQTSTETPDDDAPAGGDVAGIDPTAPPVQEQALNGAQVTSLQGIVSAVAAGELPGPSAVVMLSIAFPTVSEAEAQAMIAPAMALAASKPKEPAA